jgi:hypothetical protein
VLSLVSLAFFAVLVMSLAAGVGLGYAIIFGILYAFDRSRQLFQASPVQVISSGND